MAEKTQYNNLPEPVVNYDTSGNSGKRTGIGAMYDDISRSLVKDLVQPAIKTLTMQFVDLICNTIKSALNRKMGGGYSNIGGYSQNSGFMGNATYDPNDFRSRFNVNDSAGFAHNQPYFGNSQASTNRPWENVWFMTMVHGEQTKDEIFKYMAYNNGVISVFDFGKCCNQTWDWSYHNYGWTREQLADMYIRYNVIPKRFKDQRTGENYSLPFSLAGIPDPVLLHQ